MATRDESMPRLLSKIDDLTRPEHAFLQPDDECFYWGEYHVGKGYAHGPTNNLISNLKKPLRHRGTAQFQYKEHAIQRIGHVFAGTIRAGRGPCTVVPVPPSRIRGDPEYDDRMHRIARLMVEGSNSEVREVVTQTATYEASHLSGGGHRIRPEELMAIYTINEDELPRNNAIVILDDVLTAGAHFRAMKDTILERFPERRVIGLMVARAVHDVASDFAVL